MRILTFMTLGTLGAALAACATPADAPESPVFGQAFASMQSQIIPASVSPLPPESSGIEGTAAIRRLEKGEPKKLESQTTSNVNVSIVPYGGK